MGEYSWLKDSRFSKLIRPFVKDTDMKYRAARDILVESLCCWRYWDGSIASYISFLREEPKGDNRHVFV